MDYRIRASPRHGGQEVFFKFFVIDPPRGCPIGGGGIHRTLLRKGNNHHILCDY